MKFIFDKKTEILSKHTRIIDGHLITLKVISDRLRLFGGLIETESKDVIVEYDESKVCPEEKYKMDMALRALEYSVRANNSNLLIGIRGIDYDT